MTEVRSETTVLIALIPTPSDAEAAINSLTEQGVAERHISVITANPSDARAIINDGGPLRGVTEQTVKSVLESRHLPEGEAQSYSQGISGGHALIAVEVQADAAGMVEATLHDYDPLHTATLVGTRP